MIEKIAFHIEEKQCFIHLLPTNHADFFKFKYFQLNILLYFLSREALLDSLKWNLAFWLLHRIIIPMLQNRYSWFLIFFFIENIISLSYQNNAVHVTLKNHANISKTRWTRYSEGNNRILHKIHVIKWVQAWPNLIYSNLFKTSFYSESRNVWLVLQMALSANQRKAEISENNTFLSRKT